MGNYYKLLVFFVGILVLMSYAGALGVTPGRTPVDFQPGLERSISFSVMNSQNEKLNLVVYPEGELKEYVEFGGGKKSLVVDMEKDEAKRDLGYKVKLPDKMEPGVHTADIVILKLPEKGEYGAYVGATVAVVSELSVLVSTPGKYVEAELNIASLGDEIGFVIPVSNKGEFNIVSAKAVIDIYSKLNEKVATLNSESIEVKSKERKEIVVKWKPNVETGPYRAVATLIYDEKTMKFEKEFNVGSSDVELQNVEVRDFRLGQVAKFEMLVENKWSEPVSGAYAQTNIFDKNGRLMADFKSPAYDIPPMTKSLMVSYWDTAGVKEGTYDASIYLRNGKRSSQRDVKMEVKEDEINVIGLGYVISEKKSGGEGSGLTTILIIVIGVLVLLNVLWFFMLRKYLAKK